MIQQIEGFAEGGNEDMPTPEKVRSERQQSYQMDLDMLNKDYEYLSEEEDKANDAYVKAQTAYDTYVYEEGADGQLHVSQEKAGDETGKALKADVDEKQVAFRQAWKDAKDIKDQIRKIEEQINGRLGYRDYRRLAGEVEARTVEARRKMSAEERRNTLARSSEDTARERQIILMNAKPSAVVNHRYMELAESDGVETPAKEAELEEMVRDAAAKAMPRTQVVDEDGKPKVVYHGTNNYGFTVFNTQSGKTVHTNNNIGSHFGSKQAAEKFLPDHSWIDEGSNGGIYKVFLNITNPYDTYDWFGQDDGYPAYEAMNLALEAWGKAKDEEDRSFIQDAIRAIGYEQEWVWNEFMDALAHGKKKVEMADSEVEEHYVEHPERIYDTIRMLLRMNGYDGIKYWNDLEEEGGAEDWIALYPNQIKSAEAVTRDDEGKVIPLEDRFDMSEKDIRWMLGQAYMQGETTDEANLEAWEKAKHANPDKVIAMQDGAGYIAFRDDARKIGAAIGKATEDGMLKMTYGDYMAAKAKLGDELDESQWSAYEEYGDDVDQSSWGDGKVTKKNVKTFVREHPELKRLRKNVAEAVRSFEETPGTQLMEACEDYRQALQEMLDGEREDFKILKGAEPYIVEQISELGDIENGEKSTFEVEKPEAKPQTTKAKKGERGTHAGQKRQKKTAEATGKSQKEWQQTAPTDYEMWENTDMGQGDALGEYYDGDWQALCHAVKRGETGAIKEAARRMASQFLTLPDEDNKTVKPNDALDQNQDGYVIVPVPSHTGKATYMLKVAKELSKLTGIPYADILEAEPHESRYLTKAKGEAQPNMAENGTSETAELPRTEPQLKVKVKEGAVVPEAKGSFDRRMVILIDNVKATGKTMNACIRALDADEESELGKKLWHPALEMSLAEDNSKAMPIGQKTVALKAEDATQVKVQARNLPKHPYYYYDQWLKEQEDEDGYYNTGSYDDGINVEGEGGVMFDVPGGGVPMELWADDLKEQMENPWKDVKHVEVSTANMRRQYPQMHYQAKHGDVEAAYRLVKTVAKPRVVARLSIEHPEAVVVYPHYETEAGTNAIPAAYAQMFEDYGLTVDTGIVQTNKVHHTDATKQDRLLFRARFAGDVVPGQEYIIVDDHITSGATMRDMKDYIESKGGTVVAWSALEGSAGATNVELTKENLDKLKELGVTDEQVQKLGISRSITNLTNSEARELITLAKRGRDFRTAAQKAEHVRAVKSAQTGRQGSRADKEAESAEGRRAREEAEAAERYAALERERARFLKLFGISEEELTGEPDGEASGTEALRSGGRYLNVSGIKPEVAGERETHAVQERPDETAGTEQSGGVETPTNEAEQPKTKHKVLLSPEARAEIERIQTEMANIVEAEAEKQVDEWENMPAEERFGRYPGDPVSLRDRGIWLTPAQRKQYLNTIYETGKELGRQDELIRLRKQARKNNPRMFAGGDRMTDLWDFGWSNFNAYPGMDIWHPEEFADTEENLIEAQRQKAEAEGRHVRIEPMTEEESEAAVDRGDMQTVYKLVDVEPEAIEAPRQTGQSETAELSRTEQEPNTAGSMEETQPNTAENENSEQTEPKTAPIRGASTSEEPWELQPEETAAQAEARLRRERARKRVQARLNGSPLPTSPRGGEGVNGSYDENPEAGKAKGADKDGQMFLWMMGTGAQRPRKKRGESDFQYLARVAAWELQQQRLADAPPAPDPEEIDQRWMDQWEQDHKAWLDRHGLDGNPMGTVPRRNDFDTVDEYADALRRWEAFLAAQQDTADPEPMQLDYMTRSQDEYRQAYQQWKTDNGIMDEAEGMLNFSSIFNGEAPTPRTEAGVNVETGEEVELQPIDELEAEVAESQTALTEMGMAAGINVDARGARRAAHEAIVDRQGRLGMMRSEDAVFIHKLEDEINKTAEAMGMKGKDLNKMLPGVIESPTRMAEVVSDLYAEAMGHPLDIYWLKHNMKTIVGTEATNDSTINAVRAIINQALAANNRAMNDALRDYRMHEDPELKPIIDKVDDWYQAYFTVLENEGLNRNGSHRVTDYVNHVWDIDRSDPQAVETWKNWTRTTSPNMKERLLLTYEKGKDIGLKPKYETLTAMMGSYSNKNTEAVANQKFLMDLSGLSMNVYNTDGELVNILPLLSSEEPSALNEEKYVEFKVPGVGKIWVLKEAEYAFNTIFGDKGIRGHKTLQNIWDAWLNANGILKTIQLSLSGFHILALSEAAFTQNPLLCLKAIGKYIIFDSAVNRSRPAFAHPKDFKDAAEHLVQLGATNDFASAEVRKLTRTLREWAKEWATAGHSNLSEIGKTVAGGVLFPETFILDVYSTGMDKILWEYIHDGYKIAIYKHYADQVRKKAERQGWDKERTERQLMNVGQYVNDIFGGQAWSVIGITPFIERCFRTAMLSPDWNFSTTRQAMSAFGLGGVYSDNNFLRYVTERMKNGGKKPQEDLYWEKDKDGMKFRATRAWQMLGGVILMTAIYNIINMLTRKYDEAVQKEKADEIRKTNPKYKSPYEIQYPNGMQWYDYTMWGNSLNRRSRLFLGRNEDGTERYARFGKQFQELPDYFEGEYGWDFPGPLIKRLRAKQSPMMNLWDSLVDFWGASANGKMSTQSEQLQKKYGNAVGTVSLILQSVSPYSLNGNWEDKSIMEFFMPVGKGFSKWKARKGFEYFITNNDWNGIDMVIRSCQLNGIDAEPIFDATLNSMDAMARDVRLDGVTDLKSAMQAFDETTNVKDRNALKRKIAQYMTDVSYQTFTNEMARQHYDQIMSGTDEESIGLSEQQKNTYIKEMTAEDARDEVILTKAYAAANAIRNEGKIMMQNGDGGAFNRAHQKEINVAKAIGSARYQIGKQKKLLGNGNDSEVMNKIRDIRTKAIDKANEAGE